MLSASFAKWIVLCALWLVSSYSIAANTITAARVWPAQDYTRVAFEATAPFKYPALGDQDF